MCEIRKFGAINVEINERMSMKVSQSIDQGVSLTPNFTRQLNAVHRGLIRARPLNETVVGKISDFLVFVAIISETVKDMAKLTIEH